MEKPLIEHFCMEDRKLAIERLDLLTDWCSDDARIEHHCSG